MSDEPNKDEIEAEQAEPRSHRAAAEAAEEAFFSDRDGEGRGGAYPPLDEDPEADPELMRLPRPRRRRNPIISLAVIVLSIYMMYYLRRDLAFYLQPREPADVGEVSAALEAGKLTPNRFVTVHGVPDRKHAVVLEGGGAFSAYESFFCLQQSKSRVFVRRHRKSRSVDRELDYSHTGRVVSFASLPFLQQLKQHYARTMTVAHDLPFDAVRAARGGGGAGKLKDRQGETLAVQPDQVAWINVQRPGEWLLQFPRRLYKKEQVVRQQLDQRLAGLGLTYARDDERSHLFWRYVVLADEQKIAAVRERFKDAVLGVGVVPRQVSYTAKWKQIKVEGDALALDVKDPTFPSRFVLRPAEGDKPARLEPIKDERVRLERAEVLYLTVATKLVVPDDAVVIVTRETPAANWFYLLLYLVLGAFVVFNAWALVARLRERRQRS